MPGIATHHIFGTDVFRELSSIIGESPQELEAFLLGNLGPDPFFYLAAAPATGGYRRIGATMHKENTESLMRAVQGQFVSKDAKRPAPLKAYALGFLCHYLLDSTVHPLVYAQQHAICNSPIGELTKTWSHRVVHATIETSLDEYVMTSRLGATSATMPPHKTMLNCPLAALLEISSCYAKVVLQAYGIAMPPTAFATAVGLNRAGQQALDSKANGVRRKFDYLALAGMASAYVRALTHRAAPSNRSPFGNDDHIPWQDPYNEGELVIASFDELYQSALDDALFFVPQFARPSAEGGLCPAIVRGVNFLGRAYE